VSQQQLFELGSKFIGLYCVVSSFPNLVSGTIDLLMPKGTGDPRVSSYRLMSDMIFTLTFVLLFGIGLLLFRRADVIRKIAFPEQVDNYESNLEEPFAIGIKLFGVLLFLRTLPAFLRQLSTYIFVANSLTDTPPMVGQFFEWMGNFIPPLISLLFGLLLFFRGELLARWAFAAKSSDESIKE
jgi:hypothetical protein